MPQVDGREYQFANLIDRYIGNLVDGLIAGTLFILGMILLRQLDWFNWVPFAILMFIIVAVYYTWPVARFGQTPGFRIMDIRVIKTDGSHLGFFRVLFRNVLAIASGGFIPSFNPYDTGRQFAHDLIAGSMVVETMPELEPAINYSQAIKRAVYALFATVLFVLSMVSWAVGFGALALTKSLLITVLIPVALFVLVIAIYVSLLRQALDEPCGTGVVEKR